MAPRKRKSGRGAASTAGSMKLPRDPAPSSTEPGAPRDPVTQQEWLERYSARAEARNAEARAKLIPLAPGERPWPILAAIGLSAAAAIVNLVLWLVGTKINGKPPSAGEMVAFTVIMGVCAVGMWVLWYQAVLAFMVLLAIVVVLFSLFLVEASNVLGIVVPLVFILGGGFLFWKLVRVLARLQMPTPPSRAARR